MTPEDRELARFLAEKVMGWWLLNTRHPRWTDATGKYMEHVDAWNPANRDDHATMVVHALVARGYRVCIVAPGEHNGEATWRCSVGHRYYADAPRLPRAIAESARAALEGEPV